MNPNGHHWIRDTKRKRIYERDGWRCVWCGGRLTLGKRKLLGLAGDSPTLDHILPRALGGGNEAHNLITSCYSCNSCNSKRGDTPAVLWAGTYPNPGKVFARVIDALMADLP